MTILVVIALVVAAGLVAYLVLSVVAKRSTPLDTEKEERWFVLHAPRPLRRFLYFADRRVVGGAALAFIFTVVLVSAAFIGWVFDSIDESQRLRPLRQVRRRSSAPTTRRRRRRTCSRPSRSSAPPACCWS